MTEGYRRARFACCEAHMISEWMDKLQDTQGQTREFD